MLDHDKRSFHEHTCNIHPPAHRHRASGSRSRAGGRHGYFLLPVSPLPNIDVPTISVTASMAGASPDVMAATVATPLERHLGVIASVNEMTSSSTVGSTRDHLQFDINRNIDGAARDVQAAINAARADLPTSLRSNPTYRKVNPAECR